MVSQPWRDWNPRLAKYLPPSPAGETLFHIHNQVFLFRLVAEAQSIESGASTGRLSRDDQRDAFHLRTRGQSPVQIVRAVTNLELDLPHGTEHAEDVLLAFAESFLRVPQEQVRQSDCSSPGRVIEFSLLSSMFPF